METQIHKELLELAQPLDLGANHFKVIEEQILFQDEKGQFVITRIAATKEYNEQHFELLPENAPYQLIEARLVFMKSPTNNHQRILANLHLEIGIYVKNKKLGEVRFAPLDVRLDEKNVVQPDLLFVSIR